MIFQQISSIAEDALGEDQEERLSIKSTNSTASTNTPNNECAVIPDRVNLTTNSNCDSKNDEEIPDIELGKSVFYVVWD